MGKTEPPENVELDVEGDVLTISCDISQDLGRSKTTGKTIIVATSHGAEPVPGHDGMYFSLNIYKYPPR